MQPLGQPALVNIEIGGKGARDEWMKYCRVKFSVLCLSTVIIAIGGLQCRGNPVPDHPLQIVVHVNFCSMEDNKQPRHMTAYEKRFARMWIQEYRQSVEVVTALHESDKDSRYKRVKQASAHWLMTAEIIQQKFTLDIVRSRASRRAARAWRLVAQAT